MSWRGLRFLLLCGVVGLAILRVGGLIGAAGEVGTLSLKNVYSFTKFAWPPELGENPNPSFDPEGEHIYFIHGDEPRLEILDWKNGKSVGEWNYKNLLAGDPRVFQGRFAIYGWEFLPGTRYDLMSCPGALVLVDHETLGVDRVLLYEADDLVIRGFAYSKAQGYLAVYLGDPKRKTYRMRVYSTKDWQVVAEWGIPFAMRIAITPDERYLAITTGDDTLPLFSPGRETLELRELLSGKVISRCDLAYDVKMGPPSEIRFLPGPDYTFVSVPVPFNYIGVWNARTGALLRRIFDERSIGLTGNWDLSPDGRWVAGSLRDDPGDQQEGQQDFKIWDVQTGEVAYETPLQPWRIPWTKGQLYAQLYPLFLRFSPDSRYLLILRYKELAVYEIVEKQFD